MSSTTGAGRPVATPRWRIAAALARILAAPFRALARFAHAERARIDDLDEETLEEWLDRQI